MTSTVLKLRTTYADDSHRDLEFGPFAQNSAAITNIKSNIALVNADMSNLGQNYLSDSGAVCTGISKAQVIITEENEINLN